jgi:hypothetical protein
VAISLHQSLFLKQRKMELIFNKQTGITNGKSLEGTLATLLTGKQKVTIVGTNENNMLNPKKQGFIELYNNEDYIGRVFISARIKAELLEGVIQREDLIHYPLTEKVNEESGDTYYLITERPTEIDKVSVDKAKAPTAKKVLSWKDLQALANA